MGKRKKRTPAGKGRNKRTAAEKDRKKRTAAEKFVERQRAEQFLYGRIPAGGSLAVTIPDNVIRALGFEPGKKPSQMMHDELKLWEKTVKPILGPSSEAQATVKGIAGKTMPEVKRAIEAEQHNKTAWGNA